MDLTSVNIILGSGSPRRKQLLECLGWNPDVNIKNTEEDMPPHLRGHDVPVYLAELKASAFIDELKSNDLLITADTIVCKDDQILNKPSEEKEAFEMLKSLSGRKHEVYTGVCIIYRSLKSSFYVKSLVHFQEIDNKIIQEYILKFRPFDKAGSYGAQECLPEGMDPCSVEEKEFMKKIQKPDYFIQSLDMSGKKHIPLIRRIEGSYFNVMGLPVVELWNAVGNLLKQPNF